MAFYMLLDNSETLESVYSIRKSLIKRKAKVENIF